MNVGKEQAAAGARRQQEGPGDRLQDGRPLARRQPPGWREAALQRCRERGGHTFTSKRNGVTHCSWCGKPKL